VRVGHGWYLALVAVLLAAAYLVPRLFLRPERHPWQVWIPAAVAVAAIVYGMASRNWIFTGIFAFVLTVEVWRTLPIWRGLRHQSS
jgi:hypothetical protein